MRLLLYFLFLSAGTFGQSLSFSPGPTVEKTIPGTYYNTDYIFISNTGDQSCELEFELIEAAVPAEVSATGCTNLLCYPYLPENGPLGIVWHEEGAYFSINLSANGYEGNITIRYALFDPNNADVRDTIAFIYDAQADAGGEPAPWADISFEQNVITVFLQNAATETTLYVLDVSGNLVHGQLLDDISSVSLEPLAPGIYIVVVESAEGRRRTEKIVKR